MARKSSTRKKSFSFVPHLKVFSLMIALGTLISLPLLLEEEGLSRAAAVSCPVTDGGAGDGDATVDGTITINADATWDTTGYASLGDYWDCAGLDVHVTNNSTLTFQGDTVNGYYGYLKADNVTIDAGSVISSEGLGCAGTSGHGTGPNPSTNVCTTNHVSAGDPGATGAGGGGGANGGNGGRGEDANGNLNKAGGFAQGTNMDPFLFGAAGGGSSHFGGRGGGVIKLEVSGTVTLNGEIDADGLQSATVGNGRGTGGGAGGSIHLIADTIAGSGTISANGGNGRNSSNGYGAGGGGGRVHIEYSTNSSSLDPSTDITVNGGATAGSLSEDGGDGSVLIEDVDDSSVAVFHGLTWDNSGFASNSLTINSGVDHICLNGQNAPTLTSGSLSFSGSISCGSATSFSLGASTSLTIASGSSFDFSRANSTIDFTLPNNLTLDGVTVTGGWENNFTISDAVNLVLTGNTQINSNVNWDGLANLTIDAGSAINASEKGCRNDEKNHAYGPNGSNVCSRSASFGTGDGGTTGEGVAGGSHGGNGGNGNTSGNTGGIAYDSNTNPVLFGASGANQRNYAAGIGGGLIKLNVTGTFTHNGALTADGGDGGGSNNVRATGGGAGGSINVTAGTLSGTNGSFSADGGDGATTGGNSGGGGGGGRIAVNASTNSSSLLTSAKYAAGVVAQGGAAGGDGATAGGEGSAYPEVANTAPTVSATSVSQKTNNSKDVDIVFEFNDTDLNTLTAKVEYSIDGGSTWADPSLQSATDSVVIDNAADFQLSGIITSGGALSPTIVWDATSDIAGDTNISNAKIRVTPKDSEDTGTAATSASFIIDFVSPTEASSFAVDSTTINSAVTSWTQSTESNFNKYRIYYATGEVEVEARSGGDTAVWDENDDANLTTITTETTTLTGLSAGTTYYAVICALDDYGAETCGSDAVSFVTKAAPTAASYSAAQNMVDKVAASVTVNDNDGDNVNLKVEYSINGGSTWADPTLEFAGTLDNEEEYQLRSIDTSGGAVAVSFTWDAASDVANTTDVTDARLRITPTDTTNTGSAVGGSTDFVLDLKPPTVPANFAVSSTTSASAVLSWDASVESNFASYRVLYGTSSGSLGSTWKSENDANLSTRTTTTTSITGLNPVTTYYFQICAYDSYAHSGCSDEISGTTGAQPSVSTITTVQKTDGSGVVDVSAILNDVDGDDLRAKIEISLNGGDSWTAATLATADAVNTASTGDFNVNNASSYQLGTSGNYVDTSGGANTVSFDLAASNFGSDTDTREAMVRITPNDLGADGLAVSSNEFVVDTTNPTAPTNLKKEPSTANVMPLMWDVSVESNFDHYEIWYGNSSSNVENRSTSGLNPASEFDDDPDDSLLARIETNSTVLTNMTKASYYVMICAVDSYGNEACSDVETIEDNVPPTASRMTIGFPEADTGYIRHCTTLNDSDFPSQMQLGFDYSTDSGATWTKGTVVDSTITASVGSAPGLNNSAAYQIGTPGNYINMGLGYNRICFKWNYRTDIGSGSASGLEFRFRPYDGTQVGGAGNEVGTLRRPPKAFFSYSCSGLTCSFDGTNSVARFGDIASYSWSFGDGGTATSSTKNYVYDSAGIYNVVLTVTDTNGKSDTYSAPVGPQASGSAQALNLAPSSEFVMTCSGRTCSFDSGNSSDSDGTISSYFWNFGDGNTSTSSSPSHTYSANGFYTVRLVVTDDDGAKDGSSDVAEASAETKQPSAEDDIDENVAPTAVIAYTCDGLDCDFDATGSSDSDGSVSSYEWFFGDLKGATTAEPSHSYSTAGTYGVRLDVTDDGGLTSSAFKNIPVLASGAGDPSTVNQAPVAKFTKSCTGLTCTFDASDSSDADGSISTYQWSFGEGALVDDLGANPTKSYTRGGIYKVVLVVTDDDGAKGVYREKVRPRSYSSGDGAGFYLDESAPSGLDSLASPANTSSTLDWNWDAVTEDNFFRYEIWIGPNETKVNNRDISGEDGAVRWDEGYDPSLLTKSNTETQVTGLAEHTVYYAKMWAKDSYENEAAIASAVSQKTNDRPDVSSGSESKATDGTGKLTFTSTFGDLDEVETLSGSYYYNIGEGWQPMTLLTVSAGDGSPAVSGNTVGGEGAYIPVDEGNNEVAVIWDSKTDLPSADVSDLKIRVIPNDTIENGDVLLLEEVTLDNVAPSGLDGGAGVLAQLARPVETEQKGLWNTIRSNSRRAFASLLGSAGSASVTVSWTPVSAESNWYGIASYYVEYGLAADSLTSTWDSADDSALTTMSTSSTTITGLTSGTSYFFKVYARDAFGNLSSTDVFSVSTSASGGNVGAGGGGLRADEAPVGLLPQRNQFEFEYELPGHWSDDYLDELFQMEDVLEVLEADERAIEFAEDMLSDPDQLITRGESVLLMSMITGEFPDEDYEGENNRFTDVFDWTDLSSYILFSAEEGRVNGHDDGSFKAMGSTSRVEILKFIGEFLGTEFDESKSTYILLNQFPDVNPSAWYAPYLDHALRNDVVGGYQDGTYRPSDDVSMAEALKMALESFAL